MMRWSAYRDPAARRAAAAGARRPPYPLDTQAEALEQAEWLHEFGLPWKSVSIVMGHYHGHWAPGPAWAQRVHRARTRT